MKGSLISSACAAVLAGVLALPALGQTPDPGVVESPGPLRMHDARMAFTATPLLDGSVLVTGGTDGSTMLQTAEAFDPVSRSFRRVGDLKTTRYWHTASALPDGRVIIIGGVSAGSSRGTPSVEVFDPATESFSELGRLQEGRFGHTATVLDDGRVLVAGGSPNGGRLRFRKSAELFDPKTGTSMVVGPMHKGRMGHAATTLDDGRVVITGGYAGGKTGERSVEVYDPVRQRFLRRPQLAVAVAQPAATRLDDGRVLVVSDKSSMIAPDAKSSQRLKRRTTGMGNTTATLLEDGRVVVIGGNAEGPVRVDLFDPATDAFTPADPLQSSRLNHAAIRLADGTVLVVGGMLTSPECMQVVDTAEIWDPQLAASVAVGGVTDCEPTGALNRPALPALGTTTTGGRIEMPASAFAISLPDDWSVELADPDSDVFAAVPGTAWEALRARHPQNTKACSVSVGVAEGSLRKGSGTGSNGVTTPMWDPDDGTTLWVPAPRAVESKNQVSSMTSLERLHRDYEALDHDVLYSLLCVGVRDGQFARIMESMELLPQAEPAP